jgi:putative ATPase
MPDTRPLAEKLRPTSIEEIVGQGHITGKDSLLARTAKTGRPVSVLLWGPPGCGKTTLARIYASAFDADFQPLSAVLSGVADVRKVVETAKNNAQVGRRTVVFIDEIHRFNKAQQDAFLPYVEDGTFFCIGATTENPSFEVNPALLSRMQVLTLSSLSPEDMEELILRAESTEGKIPLTKEARETLCRMALGDGRMLLNMAEAIYASAPEEPLDETALSGLIQKRAASHDKGGDAHYNLISALHKSIRGSDPEAALYWLCRMLEGGDDPLYLARRLIRIANEDIGLADPAAITQAIAARDAYQMLGTPEGELALAQCAVYLALAPKSIGIYKAYNQARVHAAETSHMPPPKIILNAPTKLMKEQGYGDGYMYDPDTPDGFSGQNYFPDGVARPNQYKPQERGFERDMGKRMAYFDALRKKLSHA